MRFPALAVTLLFLLPAFASHARAGSESSPEMTDPADSSLDYWTDGLKAWVAETNGTLELWTEYRASASTDLERANSFYNRQADASFELTFGFTANGQPWRAMMTTQDNVPATGSPTPVRVPGNEGQSTFRLYMGDQVVLDDQQTSQTHRFGGPVAADGVPTQTSIRLPEYLTYFPRGTVLTDLWETFVVYAPQPYDKVAYRPCPGITNQGLDKVTQCIKGGSATYVIQGGARLELQDLLWTLDPSQANVAAGATFNGTANATNENSDHRTFQVHVRAPDNWTANVTDSSIHLAGQVSVLDAWSVHVPAGTTPGRYNVTFELDNGFAVKDAVLSVTVGGGGPPGSNGTANATGSSPSSSSTGPSSGGTGSSSSTATAEPAKRQTPPGPWVALAALLLALWRRR